MPLGDERMTQHIFWQSYEDTPFSKKYRLRDLLGMGGFGAVYKADEVVRDRQVRTVALKVFNPVAAPDVDACIQEFRVSTRLRHPHLIETYAIEEGTLQGNLEVLGLVMELAQFDLAKRLTRSLLSPQEARHLVQQVATALAFLHRHNIVHRDIKPHNIMAGKVRGKSVWKVGDLGIMRMLGSDTSVMTANRQGSPFYAPPEAYEGTVSPSMDTWALGVIMVQALTGQLPFPGPSEAEVMNQVLNQEPMVAPLGKPFDEIVQGCFAKDRQSRWSAQQILNALTGGNSPPPPTWNLDAVVLRSAKGVDYQPLQQLLKQRQWQAADRETRQRMLEATGRTEDGYFRETDLRIFPRADLRTIDQLWVQASLGRYGFSVQRSIYKRCGAVLDGNYPDDTVWEKFGETVGWRGKGTWLGYADLNWKGQGAKGHLPCVNWVNGKRIVLILGHASLENSLWG